MYFQLGSYSVVSSCHYTYQTSVCVLFVVLSAISSVIFHLLQRIIIGKYSRNFYENVVEVKLWFCQFSLKFDINEQYKKQNCLSGGKICWSQWNWSRDCYTRKNCFHRLVLLVVKNANYRRSAVTTVSQSIVVVVVCIKRLSMNEKFTFSQKTICSRHQKVQVDFSVLTQHSKKPLWMIFTEIFTAIPIQTSTVICLFKFNSKMQQSLRLLSFPTFRCQDDHHLPSYG